MAKRQVVKYEGESGGHRNPIPTCVTLGDLILPSVIAGQGPDNPRKAIEQAFNSMQRIIEGAGGTLDGIGKITVYLRNFDDREIVNEFWLKLFPDENNRPARHVMAADLAGNAVIQMDVIASK